MTFQELVETISNELEYRRMLENENQKLRRIVEQLKNQLDPEREERELREVLANEARFRSQ